MNFSPGQQTALQKVKEWREGPDQVFTLFGYAGTGKTTLAKHFAEDAGKVIYAAYTGKAALVMQRAGCNDATTIHRLIYIPKNKSSLRLNDLEKRLALANAKGDAREGAKLTAQIKQEQENLKRPSFTLNLESDLRDADVLILDEVSMVGTAIAEDLLTFGTKVLCLGDPKQLPPVGDSGYFTKGEPDVMLTEIHRQAIESPVIQLATLAREGRRPKLGEYGESKVVPRGSMTLEEATKYDQVLVGTNAKRRKFNHIYRDKVKGFGHSHLPVKGDRLICLRNDYEIGLLNGGMWTCIEQYIVDDDRMILGIEDEITGQTLEVQAHRHTFENREISHFEITEAASFDFGYAVTVHKAQGSQWGSVLLVDESHVFRSNAFQWLYTGITRAAERITIVNQ